MSFLLLVSSASRWFGRKQTTSRAAQATSQICRFRKQTACPLRRKDTGSPIAVEAMRLLRPSRKDGCAMFWTRWQLFRLLGIPIRIDASWLVIVALLTWTVALQFQPELPETALPLLWLWALVTALGFFLCIVLHELGHAVTARKLDIPINGITLFIFGGVAEMGGEPATPLREFLMAIAGPLVTVVLIGLFGLFWLLSAVFHWAKAPQLVCAYLTQINLLVLVFNLIPAFPLDGGRVLRSLLWGVSGNLRSATRRASMIGQGFAFFLIGIGLLNLFTGNVVGGIWFGLIG